MGLNAQLLGICHEFSLGRVHGRGSGQAEGLQSQASAPNPLKCSIGSTTLEQKCEGPQSAWEAGSSCTIKGKLTPFYTVLRHGGNRPSFVRLPATSGRGYDRGLGRNCRLLRPMRRANVEVHLKLGRYQRDASCHAYGRMFR